MSGAFASDAVVSSDTDLGDLHAQPQSSVSWVCELPGCIPVGGQPGYIDRLKIRSGRPGVSSPRQNHPCPAFRTTQRIYRERDTDQADGIGHKGVIKPDYLTHFQ